MFLYVVILSISYSIFLGVSLKLGIANNYTNIRPDYSNFHFMFNHPQNQGYYTKYHALGVLLNDYISSYTRETNYIRDLVYNQQVVLRYDKVTDWNNIIDPLVQGDSPEQTSDNCKKFIKRAFIAKDTFKYGICLNIALKIIHRSLT